MSATDIICTSCHAWPAEAGSDICERCEAERIEDDWQGEPLNDSPETLLPVQTNGHAARRAARPGGIPLAPPPPSWPQLDDTAKYGLAGTVVSTVGPQTEADPAHLLISFLTGFGAVLGRSPHILAGDAEHPPRLFAVVAGASAKSRKGTSWATLLRILKAAAPEFFSTRVLGGWGSGEAVVDEVRDPKPGETEGARDKRLLIQEGEFARILKVASRDGNTLSMTIRDAWDGARLQARSRQSVTVATDHHITMLGHITLEELRARLTEIESASGFGNRFLYVLGRQSKLLPDGGNLDDQDVTYLGGKVRVAIEKASTFNRMWRSAEAGERWEELYVKMHSDEPGGLLGALTNRDQAQCLRLSVIYALLDGSRVIQVDHVNAAWAMWRYCRESAAYIFADSLGDEVADRLLVALRATGSDGLDGAAQRAVFSNHINQKRLDAARRLLERKGLAVTTTEQTGGRPRVVTCAVQQGTA